MGFLLFDRSQSPIAITDAGHQYLLWANQILSLCENMEVSLQHFSTTGVTKIRIGILPECSAFILPSPLKSFRQNNPNIFIQIRELSSNDLKKGLENSKFDFIIGLTHSDTFNYQNEPLYDEKIVLAINSDVFTVDKDIEEVDLADFSDIPFVMMEEEQFLYNIAHALCKNNGFVPKVAVECYNLETAMHMVKAGLGVSLMPDLMCRMLGGLNYYNIKGLIPESQISVVYERERYLSREAKELIALIKSNIHQ